jgi:protein-disulfide isomerase
VFRDYPLNIHPLAQPAAEAAQCAHEQGKFWEYHDKLFENQAQLNADNFKKWAGELGLEASKFDECVASGKHRQNVLADFQAGQKVGVTGTPAFFVNGRMLSGAQPFEKFKEIIDDELK